MSNFVLLIACLWIGILLRRWKRLPQNTPEVLNGFILMISLPAMVLKHLHQITLTTEDLYPIASAWLLFLMSFLCFSWIGKRAKLDRKTIGTLVLTAGLGNTSFIGYPMIEALYGPGSLKIGILVDQFGSFLVLSSLGIVVASLFSMQALSPRRVLVRVFSFPPTYSLILAGLLNSVQYPAFITEALTLLGNTIAPLALVSVGFQLRLNLKTLRAESLPLALGLAFKLLVGPILIGLLYVGLLGARGETIHVTLLEMTMAPMITAAILATEFELNAELASLMVGVGIPISFLTVPGLFYLFNMYK